jgi:hypothetical protein
MSNIDLCVSKSRAAVARFRAVTILAAAAGDAEIRNHQQMLLRNTNYAMSWSAAENGRNSATEVESITSPA